MERFVIGAALVVAAAIAVGSVFGHVVSDGDGFRIEFDGDEPAGAAGPATPGTAAPAVYAGQSLRVRNAAAILNVIPEERGDISIAIVNPGRVPMPTVRLSGEEVIVEGNLPRSFNCSTPGMTVHARGFGTLSASQLPVITARVPRAVKLATRGAVKTDIGPSASARLDFTGCGDAALGDVAGALELSSAGSGDVVGGAVQSALIKSAASGDTTLGAVNGRLKASLAGSGDMNVASLTGPLEVNIAGSGDVAVTGGAVADADISIAGSGGVQIDAPVQRLEVSIAGSGDVTVEGAAASLKASIMGSGDVSVRSVSGPVEKSVLGSGSVDIGN